MQEITPTELKAQLDAGETPLLIDVREPWEVEIGQIAGSRNIPLQQLPNQVDKLERNARIVTICHHGMRSLQAAQFLEQKGFADVGNLVGGVDGWSRTVDASLPLY